MKKTIEQMIPEVWKVFRENLIIFIPPAFVFILYGLVFVAFAAIFVVTMAVKIGTLTNLFSNFTIENWKSLLSDVTIYSVLIFLLFLCVMFFISILHGAGWGNMFACAAVSGKTGFGDYLDGITRFTVRIGAGTILKMCLQVIPFLLWGVLIVAVAMAYWEKWTVLIAFLILLLPPILLLEMLIGLFLWMWRPACLIDNIGAVEAFGRSIKFVKSNFVYVILVFLLWFVSSIFISGVFLLISLLGQTLLQSLGREQNFLLPFFLSMNINLLSWSVSSIIMVYFILFFYILYKERSDAAIQAIQPHPIPTDPMEKTELI